MLLCKNSERYIKTYLINAFYIQIYDFTKTRVGPKRWARG